MQVGEFILEKKLHCTPSGQRWVARNPYRLEYLLKTFAPGSVNSHDLALYQQEAHLGARFSHPNLVLVERLVHEVRNTWPFGGEPVGSAPWEFVWTAEPWVHGANLADVLAAHGKLPPPAVAAIAVHMLRALACLAGERVTHGAVRPRNVLVDTTGMVRLVDLSSASFRLQRGPTTLADTRADERRFLAPEVVRQVTPAPSCDLFSVGATMAELLTGKPLLPGAMYLPFAETGKGLRRPAASAGQRQPRRGDRTTGAVRSHSEVPDCYRGDFGHWRLVGKQQPFATADELVVLLRGYRPINMKPQPALATAGRSLAQGTPPVGTPSFRNAEVARRPERLVIDAGSREVTFDGERVPIRGREGIQLIAFYFLLVCAATRAAPADGRAGPVVRLGELEDEIEALSGWRYRITPDHSRTIRRRIQQTIEAVLRAAGKAAPKEIVRACDKNEVQLTVTARVNGLSAQLRPEDKPERS